MIGTSVIKKLKPLSQSYKKHSISARHMFRYEWHICLIVNKCELILEKKIL